MKFTAVASLLCLASTAEAFIASPPSTLVTAVGGSTARQRTSLAMTSPLPPAIATLLQSSIPLLASGVAEPGSVDAPAWVLPAGAAAVVLTAGLIPLLLKPGDDAAKDMQERDEALWEQNKKL